MDIKYQLETDLSAEEFQQVLRSSTLGERRPVEDLERLRQMVKNANLTVTARLDGKLIGVARSVSDFAYCTYLSDLAVDEVYQRRGIGRELIRRTSEAAPMAKVILLSAPAAVEYYPRIGMERHTQAYLLADAKDLK